MLGVGGIIVEDGRVLLIQRGQPPQKGSWSLPGGLVETGERLEEALRREVREETGLEVQVISLAGVFERIEPDAEGRIEYHYVLLDYLCRVTGGALRPGSDVSQVAWASPSELDRFQLTSGTREFLEKILQASQR